MIMTLQEVMDTCPDWDKFCELKGFSEYAVKEAHKLGIVKLPSWKVKD